MNLLTLTRSAAIAVILAGLVAFLPGLYRIQAAEATDTPRPLARFTETAMPATQRPFEGFCTDRTRIVQDCEFGALSRIRALEQAVIADLIKFHALPAASPSTPVAGGASPLQGPQDTASRLLSWERDTLRTLLFDKIAVIINKAPAGRTAEEQAIINALTERVRQTRLTAATEAKRFYNQWANNPCTFTPPAAFSYTPPADCHIPNALSGIFQSPPSLEQFQAYGAAVAYERYMTDADLRAAAANAAKAYGFLGGIAAAGLAAVAAYSFATTGLGSSLAIAIAPYAGVITTWNSTTGVVTLTTGASLAGPASVASFAGTAFVIVTAIVVGVIAGITVFTAAEIPGKLDQAIAAAQTAPDLSAVLATDAGKQEIFAAYLLTTVPAANSPTPLGGLTGWSPVPAARPGDQAFLLNPGPAEQLSADLVFKGWNRPGVARLSQGWFVNDNATGGPAMTLHFDYINHAGEQWSAWRVGDSFLHTTAGDVKPSFKSDLWMYQDPDGINRTARISAQSGGAPTAAPVVFPPANDAGWNNTAVTVVWNWRDNSGTGLDRSTCPERTELLRGATELVTCTDRAGNRGSASVNVKIDTNPPQFNGPPTVSPAPNAAGWNNTDVTVTFACNDGDLPGTIVFEGTVSGVASCGPDRVLRSEGRDQFVTAQAEDVAGNTTVRRFGPFNIDKTAPRFVSTPTDQTIGGTSATGGRVPVLEATDNLDPSPVVSCMPAIGAALPLGPTRVTCTATDAAGNTTAPVSVTLTIMPGCNGVVATIVAQPGVTTRGTPGNDVIAGTDGPDEIYGSSGDDIICGGGGDDRPNGEDGNDTLYGEGGDDTLDGGVGGDELFGGAGNDRMLGGAGNDWLEDHEGMRQVFDGGSGDSNRCIGVRTAMPGGSVTNCQNRIP